MRARGPGSGGQRGEPGRACGRRGLGCNGSATAPQRLRSDSATSAVHADSAGARGRCAPAIAAQRRDRGVPEHEWRPGVCGS